MTSNYLSSRKDDAVIAADRIFSLPYPQIRVRTQSKQKSSLLKDFMQLHAILARARRRNFTVIESCPVLPLVFSTPAPDQQRIILMELHQ